MGSDIEANVEIQLTDACVSMKARLNVTHAIIVAESVLNDV